MRILNKTEEIKAFQLLLKKRATASDSPAGVMGIVKKILSDVHKKGNRAVINYTQKFDSLKIKDLRIKPAEIIRFANKADKKIIKALELSAKRIRTFHEMQKEESWHFTEGRTVLGQIVRPLDRVGVYVPGGKASYPSSVLMNVIPAQVAGVNEIALCVPTPRGEANPFVMAAIKMLSLREIYRIGGAQAIGAMAYGTETIKKVDKIAGPGNIYVAMAKRMVFGEVDIDMIAGPSEILVIADKKADPVFVAADLLSQAEHDELASSILITDSKALASAVQKELSRQLLELKRKGIARKSLNNYGAVIIVKTLLDAAKLANEIAPEHLEIMTDKPHSILSLIKNAGAIFLGRWTPEPIGDYMAGPNHTLPTGGTARFFSPLGVYDFVKRSSLLSFSKEGFMELAKPVMEIADIEGLDAHGNTVKVRLDTDSQT